MEGKSGALKEYIAKLKEVKKTEWIMIILVLSIIISIYASTLNKSSNTNQDDTLPESQSGLHWIENDDNIESREEQRLKEILSTIKGAGRVEVMITYVSSKEIVTAMNTVESTTTTEEEDNNGGTRLKDNTIGLVNSQMNLIYQRTLAVGLIVIQLHSQSMGALFQIHD
jgi:stage III sporulation protein AG